MMPCGEDDDLLIFTVGSCRSAILATSLTMYGPGHDEGRAEPVVEPLGQVPGQLQVLALVLADGHLVGLVEQDVGRLQDRVGEQARRWPGRRPTCCDLSLNWIIRLASPNPVRQLSTQAQLGVLGDVALHEDRAPLRVKAGARTAGRPRPCVRARSSAGSCGTVIACRSTTQ